MKKGMTLHVNPLPSDNANEDQNNLRTALFFPKDQTEYNHNWGLSRQTRLWGFQQSKTQTSLLSYRGKLEILNFICSMFRYDTFRKANIRGADQTARIHRLVCTFVVRKPPKTGFLVLRPNYGICSSYDLH